MINLRWRAGEDSNAGFSHVRLGRIVIPPTYARRKIRPKAEFKLRASPRLTALDRGPQIGFERSHEHDQNVCVYCGSGAVATPAFTRSRGALGRDAGGRGHRPRLWRRRRRPDGRLARATLAAGGHVTGVIPEFLAGRNMR